MSDCAAPTRRMLDFIDASPTPFHVVHGVAKNLTERGFSELSEGEAWSLASAGRYFVRRTDSTIAAFVLGTAPVAEGGFRLVGAHVDSPNLRLKPRPATEAHGYRQLGVEVYGGVLLASWTDRDLGLAGRLVLRGGKSRLLLVSRPICRVPQLAIHLNREIREKGLHLNAQKHLPPVIGLSPPDGEDTDWFERFLAAEAQVEPDEVVAFDLMLHDVTPSVVSGLDGEFVHAPRLDNLASCHAALEALTTAADDGDAAATRGFVFYDHEEVGSQSAEGAGSPFLEHVLERIATAMGGDREALHRGISRSLFVSADMAHAVHPNYADRHDAAHGPRLNAGPVIKINANVRYATNAPTAAGFEELAREAEVPVQKFVNRTDLACGSTIGPITAARLGMPTVDVGNPMLSMHSVREMAGSRDHELMIRVLRRHYA